MKREMTTRALCATAIIAASTSLVQADLTPIDRRATHVDVFNALYGPEFTAIRAVDGNIAFDNGSITATRVDTIGEGSRVHAFRNNAIISNRFGESTNWDNAQLTVVAPMTLDGWDRQFAYYDDDGYAPLFTAETNDRILFDDVHAADIDLHDQSFAWIRSSLTNTSPQSSHAWSSRLTVDVMQPEEIATYQVHGLDRPGNVWLLLWGDFDPAMPDFGNDFDDTGSNDIGNAVLPVPGAALLSALGFAFATRVRPRRRLD